MHKFILFVSLLAVIVCTTHITIVRAAYGRQNEAAAQILKYNNEVNPDGSYKWDYSSNSINAQEQGVGSQYASGGFSYYSPEGELIQLSYLADGDGFQPQGNHLPTPPPIPPEILKSLEYNRAHPYDEYAEKQQPQQQYRKHRSHRQHY